MEHWQKSFIKAHLPDLINLTRCTPMLLVRMEAGDIISSEESEILTSIGLSNARVKMFYDIIVGRTGAFEVLVKALEKESQTGALAYLHRALTDHLSQSPAQNQLAQTIRFATTPNFILTKQILVVATLDTEITVRRFQDMLGPHVPVHHTEYLHSPLPPVNGFNIEIVVCRTKKVDQCLELIKSKKTPTKFIIVVANPKDKKLEKIKRKFYFLTVAHDNLTWRDLHEDSQEGILKSSVLFQGSTVPLNDIFKNISPEIRDKHLNGQFLIDLIKAKCPLLVSNSVPMELNYYIPRRIQGRQRISMNIFEASFHDILLFKDIEWHQLTKLANGKETDLSSRQLESDAVRAQFIVLEVEEDYRKICDLSKFPVHLLSFQGGNLSWIKTHGSIELIQRFVIETGDEGIIMDEAKLLEVCLSSEGPVCVFDSPGMGKSILAAKLCEDIMKKHPTRLVKFVVLREFVQELMPIKVDKISKDIVCEALAQSSGDQECGREVVRNLLASEATSCELVFDGFDEVLPDQVEIARKIFKVISSLPGVRLYVTTRPHMRQELELSLGVLGYNLIPFEDEDQVNFLVKYWTTNGATMNSTLVDFAKLCLQMLKETMTDFERDITGIPLQCKLLAQVHLESAQRCSTNADRLQLGLYSRISSIFEMYNEYLNMGFNKYTKYFGKRKILQYLFRSHEQMKQELLSIHMYHALNLLYPEWAPKFIELLHLTPNKLRKREHLFIPGVLETKGLDSSPRFVHRTFAEFLVSRFTFNESINSKDNFSEFLINLVFATRSKPTSILMKTGLGGGNSPKIECHKFEYPVVCYFLNSLLKSDTKLKSASLKLLKNKVALTNFTRLFTAALVHDYSEIARFIGDLYTADPEFTGGLDNASRYRYFTLLGAKYSSKETLKVVNEVIPVPDPSTSNSSNPYDVAMKDPSFVITPLHVAVQKGKYDLVELFVSHWFSGNPPRYLLHICVNGSVTDSKSTIKLKSQIIKMLVARDNSLLEEMLPDLSTPIVQPGAHISLVKCLYDAGADINVVTHRNENLLHSFVKPNLFGRLSADPSEYHEVVIFLQGVNFQGFNQQDKQGRTPLHAAMETTDILPETVDIFIERGLNLGSSVDNCGDSVLAYALRFGRADHVVQKLMSVTEKAVGTLRNYNGETLLYVAARHGNVCATKLLLSGNSIFSVDNNGANALHSGVTSRSQAHVYIQRILLERGLDPQSVNSDGNTPFIHGLRNGKGLTVSVIKLMEDFGLQLDPATASKGLRGLLTNENIMVQDWDLISTAQYLMSKVGEFSENLWELQNVQMNLIELAESIEVTDKLLETLSSFRVLNPHDRVKLASQESGKLGSISLIQIFWKRGGTFEKLMLSLILCNQVRPFHTMRRSLQAEDKRFANFSRAPPGVLNFLFSSEPHLFLISDHTELTIQRLRETIGQNIQFIGTGPFLQFTSYLDNGTLLGVICGGDQRDAVVSKFNFLRTGKDAKLICITLRENSDDTDFSQTTNGGVSCHDKLWWEALSPMLQKQLVNFLNVNVLLKPSQVKNIYSHRHLLLLMEMFKKPVKPLKYLRVHLSRSSLRETQLNLSFLNPNLRFKVFTDLMELVSLEPQPVSLTLVAGSETNFNAGGELETVSDSEYARSYLEFYYDLLRYMTWQCPSFFLSFLGVVLSEVPPTVPTLYVRLLKAYRHHNKTRLPRLEIVTDPSQRVWGVLEHFEHIHGCITHYTRRYLNVDINRSALCYYAFQKVFPKWVHFLEPQEESQSESLAELSRKLADTFQDEILPTEQSRYYIALVLLGDELSEYLDQVGFTKFLSEVLFATEEQERYRFDFSVFKHDNLVRIIDRLLELRPQKHIYELEHFVRFVKELDETARHTILTACIVGNYLSVLKTITQIVRESSVRITNKVIVLAVLCGSLPLVEYVFKMYVKQETRHRRNSDQVNSPITSNPYALISQIKASYGSYSINLLQLALYRGDEAIFKHLLQLPYFDINAPDLDNKDATLMHSVFNKEPSHNLVESARILIENQANVNAKDAEGLTPLHYAVRYCTSRNLVNAIGLLISNGCDVQVRDANGDTMMHMAPQFRPREEYHLLVQLLIDNELEQAFGIENRFGLTCLHSAVVHLEILETTLAMIIAHTDINGKDPDGNNVLFHAIRGGRSEAFLELLIRFGAEWKSVENRNGLTVLHFAVIYGNVAAFKLFTLLGCDLNAKAVYLWTPLEYLENAPEDLRQRFKQVLEEMGGKVPYRNE